jgi:hypothetical protein
MKRKLYSTLAALLLLVSTNLVAQTTINIGTGTGAQRQPIGYYFGFERSANIYLASEIGGSGTIDQLTYTATLGTAVGRVPARVFITTVSNTAQTAGTWASVIGSLTPVFNDSITIPATVATTAPITIPLTTPFVYNATGTTHLLIMIECNQTGTGFGLITGSGIQFTASSTGRSQTWATDNAAPTGNGTLSANLPNIGIRFSTFTPADFLAPAISFTPLPNTTSTTNPVLSSVITDAGGVASGTLAPRVYFKKSTDANTGAGWKSVATSSAASPYSFTIDYSLLNAGSAALGDTIQYFVVAQDVPGNVGSSATGLVATNVNTITTYPTGSVSSYRIFAGTLSGVVTVPGTYPTLAAMANALNTNQIGGALTVNITGTFAERISIGPLSGVSATNRVTINGGGTTTINGTGTAATTDAMITLNGADFVTLRGITINDGGTGVSNQVEYGVLLQNASGTDGAQNNRLVNLNITLGGGGATAAFSHGVLISTVATAASGGNHNNTLDSLTVANSDRGVGLFATSATLPDTNNTISNSAFNSIGNNITTTGGSAIGIITSFNTNVRVQRNRVNSVAARNVGATVPVTGIQIQNCGGELSGNIVDSVFHANPTTTANTLGIQTGVILGGTLNVFNNMVSNVSRAFTAAANGTTLVFGIRATNFTGGGGTTNIWNNTVEMKSAAAVPYTSAALQLFGGGLPVNVRGNLLINRVATTTLPARGYALVDQNATRTFMTSNFNNVFAPAANGAIGFVGTGAALITLQNWRDSSRTDSASISKNVNFVAANNLRLTGASNGDFDLRAPRLAAVLTDIDGQSRFNPTYMGCDEASTPLSSASESRLTPDAFALSQNYPNPFNPSTTINYDLPMTSEITLKVYDVLGREVATLVNGRQNAGRYTISFNASTLASGVYFYRLQAGNFTQSKKMMLVK